MLKACVSYSKKVPVDGLDFSSQGYSLTLETEIPESDPGAIQSRLHQTFELVKSSVEHELANGNGTPPAAQPADGAAPRPASRNGNGTRGNGNTPDRASNKQIKFITDLWTQSGGAVADLNARIREQFKVEGLYELTRRQASTLLDDLQQATRKAA